MAAAAQVALARGLARIAVDVAEEKGMDTIGVSGGVAYNRAIVEAARRLCVNEGFKFRVCEVVPCGDGGISYGQVLDAIRRLEYD